MSRAGRRGRTAFTLIEVMVAVTLLALLASAAVLTFNGPLNRARAVEAVEQVRYLDASTRDLARRSGRAAALLFDLDDNTLARREAAGREPAYRATLASPIRIESIRTAGRQDDYGSVTIPVSALALSPSYAIKLSSPTGARWIVVSGLSGDVRVFNDDAQVKAILAQATPRRDAD